MPGVVVATLLVGVALWRAQYPGVLVDIGLLTYPHNFSETTKYGWPAFWVLRDECADVFVPSSRQMNYSVLSGNLAVDLVVWIAVVIATARIVANVFLSRAVHLTIRFLHNDSGGDFFCMVES